jgi:hypothetical protein
MNAEQTSNVSGGQQSANAVNLVMPESRPSALH